MHIVDNQKSSSNGNKHMKHYNRLSPLAVVNNAIHRIIDCVEIVPFPVEAVETVFALSPAKKNHLRVVLFISLEFR